MSDTPTPPEAAAAPPKSSLWRHLKTGGLYRVLAGRALLEATLAPVVVYENLATREVWVRPLAEFIDGRFERAAPGDVTGGW